MAKRNPKLENFGAADLLRSDAFNVILDALEAEHPRYTGLDVSATMEQRAAHQIKIQEYESVLSKLKSWRTVQKATELESTYEPQTKGK